MKEDVMKKNRRYQFLPGLAVPLCLMAALAHGSDDGAVASHEISQQEVDAISEYWTPERMKSAKPREMERVHDGKAIRGRKAGQMVGSPGFATGCHPRNASTCESVEYTLSESELEALETAEPMGYGVAPTDPLNGPYGPFQRWGEHLPYTAYPKSTIGKLWFTLNGQDYVCSASVINRSTLATAGHCVSDGAGTFAINFKFCPSYQPGTTEAANKPLGCWVGVYEATSYRWHTLHDADYDYACIVTATTGTDVNARAMKIGNVTGWLGRTWNLLPKQPIRSFGYPQGAPFDGYSQQTTASTEWYNVDFQTATLSTQISKAIGSDFTGGSSGGPWIVGWIGNYERADTDASSLTDPTTNGVRLNGVNSHKRCLNSCGTPPTSTSGLYWQEMTSPPFMSSSAGGESEDIFSYCLVHPNNK